MRTKNEYTLVAGTCGTEMAHAKMLSPVPLLHFDIIKNICSFL
jgi:hypothetical protein